MNDPNEEAPAPPSRDPRALERLVIRCQLGDAQALDRLVLDWHPAVYRYSLSFVRAPGEADEVCQNVWLGVLRGLPGLREHASFAPWLFGVARRSAFDWMRARRRGLPEEPWPADLDPREPDEGHSSFDRGALNAGMAHLAPLEREVILLHYFEELPIDQISAAIGAPAGTVKSRLHRARRKLRAQLEDSTHD